MISAWTDLHTLVVSTLNSHTLVVLVEPIVSNVTLNEGDELRMTCRNLNLQGLSITYWLNPNGQNITSTPQNEILIRNASRNYAGTYTCVIASTRDNSTATKLAYVTIQCKIDQILYDIVHAHMHSFFSIACARTHIKQPSFMRILKGVT